MARYRTRKVHPKFIYSSCTIQVVIITLACPKSVDYSSVVLLREDACQCLESFSRQRERLSVERCETTEPVAQVDELVSTVSCTVEHANKT